MSTATPETPLAPEAVQHRAGVLAALIQRAPAAQTASAWDDRPIREELFSVERLEQHARSLASAQPVAAARQGRNLLRARLADNEAVLLVAYRDVADAIDDGRGDHARGGVAGRQLSIVVEQQIREIRADLPPGYYRQLPKLAGGPFTGYPRVFGLAWAFVAHTDSRFDPEMLCRYVRAYQEVQPLTIGELWAVAITLRIVLVENLRRLAELIVHSRAARQRGGRSRRPLAGRRRPRRRSRRRRCSPVSSGTTLLGRVRRPARAPAARPGSQDHAGADLARPASGARRERPPTRSCATSIRGRAPRTSRCATSSPACA